jgi:hypothetical protein
LQSGAALEKNGGMVTDLSRLSSPSCPAARALRLRDRLAARRGPAWTIAAALVKRFAKVTPSAGASAEKLRPGASRPTVSASIALSADALLEPPWQQEGEGDAKGLSDALSSMFESLEDTFLASRRRPQALVGDLAIPSLCLTPRLLPTPAARAS